jgi:flagellar motor switch protein FliM
MSNAPANNLSKQKIQQLLIAVASKPAEDTTQIEATDEYDWNRPHCFSNDQRELLNDFTEQIAKAIAKKFADLCPDDFKVAITSTSEHFAAEITNQLSQDEQKNHYLAFNSDQNHLCGCIIIPPKTATILTAQLLGDTESQENSDRELSQLEMSLLLDAASAIVQALSNSHDNFNFHPGQSIVGEQLLLELQGTEEFCKITFDVKKADSENGCEAQLLILCDTLNPIVGKTTQAAGGFSAEDISKAILDRLQETPIFVTAQLASATLAFEEIMSLQVNDILLLDKEIDEPVELVAEGRTLFHGQAAKSTGKYAVVITELCDTE